MRRKMGRLWRWLEGDPGPVMSVATWLMGIGAAIWWLWMLRGEL